MPRHSQLVMRLPWQVLLLFNLPDENISSSISTNADTYNHGTDVFFKLGDVFNSEGDLNSEYAVIEFNVLVTNHINNQSGTTRNNNFSVLVDENGSGDTTSDELIDTSGSVRIYVAEPELSVDKALSVVPSDAGDLIEYTITVTNIETGDNDATAFDLIVTDELDPYIIPSPVVSISTTQGATCIGNGSGTTSYSDDGGGFSGQDFSFSASCLDQNQTITIIIQGNLANDTPAGYDLQNTANLTWTSLPGDKGTTVNPTGSDVDDGSTIEDESGGFLGERNGSESPTTNDYVTSDDEDLILDFPSALKEIVSTTESHTSEVGDGTAGNPRDLAIGEVIRYRLAVELVEGTNTNLSIEDTLPAGFSFVDNSTVTIAFWANMDIDEPADLAGADNDDSPPTFSMPSGRISVSGQVITYTLGTLVNNDINDGNSEYVVIDFDVLVNNDANNNNTDLDNNDFDVLLDGTIVDTSNQVGTRIVEPLLTVAKVSQETEPNYGETFTYDLTVSYLGASLAQGFDITISDTIPLGLTYVPASAGPASWSPSYDGPTRTLTWICSSPACTFLLGNTIGLFYDVAMAAAPGPPDPDVDLTNFARLEWTSLDGPNSNERTGDNNLGTEPQNDYAFDTSEVVTLSNVDLRIEKSDRDVSFDAGDTLVYDLNIFNDGNIDATGVEITETVPLHTTFDLAGSSGTWSCADNAPAGTTCTQALGVVAPGGPTTVQFAVTIDNPLPTDVTTITNNVSIADDGNNGPEPTPENNNDTEVTPGIGANPDLTITKDDGIEIGAPGTGMVYQLVYQNVGTQDATGVVITETVSTGVTFDLGNSSPGWVVQATGNPAVDGETAGTVLEFDVGNLNAGDPPVTVNYAVIVDNPLAPGITVITNTATIADDGSNGPDLTPDNNSDDDVDGIATHSKTLTSQLHTAGDVATIPDAAIGQVLTYEVVLTVPVGTMDNTHLIDSLDRGLAYVSCEGITAPGITTTATGGFSNVCTNPTVTELPVGNTGAENQGRQVDFDFATLENLGPGPATLTLSYRVVVLNSLANQSGSTPLLVNDAEWVWNSGTLDDQAEGINILEPDLSLSKVAYPITLYPGQLTTFTLTVAHTAGSQTSAFDVVVEDIIPTGLIFQSATHISGQVPVISTAGDPTILIQWDEFLNDGTNSVIEIVVMLDPEYKQTRNTQSINNDASLAWTSLPTDLSNPQSPHNSLSTERFYDPLSDVNIYGVGDEANIRIPSLPDTGFAPGVVTDIPLQKDDQEYSDLDGLRVEIPKLNKSVPIVSVPLTDSGWDLTWLWNQAGWLEGTAYPSWFGNTVITGHAYLPSGYPGPFVNLGDLTWGDEIFLYAHGLKYTYQVRSANLVDSNDYSILQHKDQDWLTLFTCKEYNDLLGGYLRRHAVQAVLIDVDEIE